jgi:anti-anti-sigma factor
VCVVAPEGEIDVATAPVLAEHLRAQTTDGPAHLVLDLAAVRFLAAAGVALIMSAQRGDGDVHGELHLVGVHGNRSVERVLRLTGVLPVLSVHDDVDALLQSLGGS